MEELFMNIWGAGLIAFFGILFIPIGLPLKMRKIKRNNLYGFKMKYTLEDDEIWYEVNELLGRQMFYQGIAYLVISIPFFIFRDVMVQTIGAGVFMLVFFVCIGYSIKTGVTLMNKMAEEKGLKK
ncbi:MAG: SdpI family protein [bacterium]|nr:SdpI family protein [bacterium]